jgi:hypothetical protein
MRSARWNRKSLFLFQGAAVLLAVMVGWTWAAEAKKATKSKTHEAEPDCKKDSDCVLVPDDCCSCSQGGTQRAIPKKDKDTYEKDRKKRCAATACTEAMSNDPSCSQVPICGAGICELGEPPTPAPAAPSAP